MDHLLSKEKEETCDVVESNLFSFERSKDVSEEVSSLKTE